MPFDAPEDLPDLAPVWDGEDVCIPDALDLVAEAADMMAVFAADRAVRVDALRRETVAEAAAHGRTLVPVVERSLRLELSARLRITESAAGDLLAFSESLVHRYPNALNSLARAGMTERHAQILVAELDAATPDVRTQLTDRAVALAEEFAVGSFRRQLRRLIATAEVDTLAERHADALTRRRVVVEQIEDGMAWIHALLPAVEAQAMFGRLTAISRSLSREEGETRTREQLRADVLCDLLIEGEVPNHPASARGIRATVMVTVPVLSLLDDEGARIAGPAEVEGVGPIPIERARELCGAADEWMRILTDPETGMVLSVGRTKYRPPEPLRKLVRWRADRCMGPGCGMPSSRCEIDHTIAWEDGGETSLGNLAPLCKGHHTIKHHGGWAVRQMDGSGGAIEWTSPAGRVYVVHPERRVPVFRPAVAEATTEGLPPF